MTDYKLVPVVPTPEHIDSIAMRYRHDFGLLPEDQRDNLRRFARQMYEECTGQGFYQIQPAPAVQGGPLRYTNDGALAECPCCGSLDVGGAHDTVHCQSCGLTVTKPRPLQNAIDAWNARTGRTHPAPAVQGEPVAWMTHHDEPMFFATAREASAYCDHDENPIPLYAAPQPAEQQPAPDVAGLVKAAAAALDEIEAIMHEAYNSAYPVCCGRAGSECCGSPDPEWDEVDQRIMDRLSPHQRALNAALAAHRKQGGEV